MKKLWADKWVAALRSGNYKQTQGRLKKEDAFCCLGVLCDIVKDKVKGKWVKTEEASYYAGADIFAIENGLKNEDEIIPEEVMNLTGLKTPSGHLAKKENLAGDIDSLVDLNDAQKYNFEQIADVIEKKWRTL